MNKKFPDGFLWGAATSSHQVEGGTFNNWSEWEKENAERLAKEAKNKWQKWQQEKFPEMFDPQNYISGKACDHYNRYEEDFNLAKEGGHNAHRFSIEWSRIELEEGKFDEKEIEHYRKVIIALRERGIEPFITLWHWTNPIWLENMGGVGSKKFSFYFARYAKIIVERLGKEVNFWVTLNEPTSIIATSYAMGIWPPQRRGLFSASRAFKNLSMAHNSAYDEIHKIASQSKVGIANIMIFNEPNNPNSFLDKISVRIANYFSNEKFLNMTKGKHDFLTSQFYFHKKIKFPAIMKKENGETSDLGWEIYPEGIYNVLKEASAKFKLPIYITENGLADADDSRRENFIYNHLSWIHKAISEGVNVRGYFYWSLLDNFEWDKGFWPRFGLIEMDYKTLERKPRKSFYAYKKIIENNGIEREKWEKRV